MDRENDHSPLTGIIALAIIGALTAILIYSIYLTTIKWPAEQARNQHAYDQAASAPENLLLICPPSHDGKPIAPEQCKRSGQYEHDRRQQMSDHRAQISMKHAAWWTVGFTFIGLVLVSFTLVQASRAASLAVSVLDEAKTATGIARDSLRVTQKFSMEQLKEARRATSAANDTTRVTRDMGVAQTRAYISIKNVTLIVPVVDDLKKGWNASGDGEVKFFIVPVFENTGNTPAYNIKYKFKIKLMRNNSAILESDFGEESAYGSIGHKRDTSDSSFGAFCSQDVTGINTPIDAKNLYCWVTVRVEYEDVFRNTWYTLSRFSGHPDKAVGVAVNAKDLVLEHFSANDEHG